MLSQLIGIWLYSGLIFHGQPIEKPSPELVIYFQFNNSLQNSLFYFRQGERGYCERKANFTLVNDQLVQKIVSIDDGNSEICSQDPDMQIGRESVTRFEIKGNQFFLHLDLGDDMLTYVWTKVGE